MDIDVLSNLFENSNLSQSWPLTIHLKGQEGKTSSVSAVDLKNETYFILCSQIQIYLQTAHTNMIIQQSLYLKGRSELSVFQSHLRHSMLALCHNTFFLVASYWY